MGCGSGRVPDVVADRSTGSCNEGSGGGGASGTCDSKKSSDHPVVKTAFFERGADAPSLLDNDDDPL